MPRNVEIKAHDRRPERLRAAAERLATEPPRVIEQRDTFFHGRRGRLKLRRFADGTGELIAYERPDGSAPKTSDYVRAPTGDPEALADALARALGVRGEVVKRRRLVLVGQTRVHLDEVEDLGRFVELEVVLEPGQTVAEGRAIAEELMATLGIETEDLLEDAYIDLLERKGTHA